MRLNPIGPGFGVECLSWATAPRGGGVGDRVVAPHLGEPFVQGMGQQVVVVRGRLKKPVAEGLELELAAHAAELEVPKEQIRM